MRTRQLDGSIRLAAGAALLALTLAGCDKPAPQVTPEPAAQPAPAPEPATPEAPPSETTPAPSPDAPPPTEPSAVPKPASTPAPDSVPPVDTMLAAIPSKSSKMGVGVDLRYSFDGAVLTNQPVTVNLAAVPRVGYSSLTVTVQEAPGYQLASTPLTVQKASASGVYRQQFSMTKVAANPEPLRVLVIAEMGENSAFGYFTIPLPDGTNPQKTESVKLR
jgi:hypothetical protein